MDETDIEGLLNSAREGNPMILALAALAAVAVLVFGFKLARFAIRISGAISTLLTVIGVLIWVREQFANRDQPDTGPV